MMYALTRGAPYATRSTCATVSRRWTSTRARHGALLPADGIIDLYLDALRKDKPRNCRENLKAIRQGAPRYSQPTLTEAFGLCLKHGVLNGHDLLQVAESLRMRKGESLAETEPDYTVNERPYVDGMTPEKTDINTFKKLFQ